MSFNLSRVFLSGAATCAAAMLGLSVAGAAQAQPYSDQSGYSDDAASVGGLTVTAPPRRERDWNGADIVDVSTSRVVDVSDLDLSTGWGQHVMRQRIRHAAADACSELDMEWTEGFYPTADSSDADCYRRTVDDAMANLPAPAYARYYSR